MRCIHTPLLIAKKRKYRNKPRVAVRGQNRCVKAAAVEMMGLDGRVLVRGCLASF